MKLSCNPFILLNNLLTIFNYMIPMMKKIIPLKSEYFNAKEWSKRARPENQSLRLFGKIDPLRTNESSINK